MTTTKEMDEYMLNLLDELKEIILKRNQEVTETKKEQKIDHRLFLSEAAEYIGCSESKLRDMIRRGNAPQYFKVGTRYIFRESQIIKWMREQENK